MQPAGSLETLTLDGVILSKLDLAPHEIPPEGIVGVCARLAGHHLPHVPGGGRGGGSGGEGGRVWIFWICWSYTTI